MICEHCKQEMETAPKITAAFVTGGKAYRVVKTERLHKRRDYTANDGEKIRTLAVPLIYVEEIPFTDPAPVAAMSADEFDYILKG